MFCPKCGSQAIDGAGFCQKCGAKLNVDDTAPQPADPRRPPDAVKTNGGLRKAANIGRVLMWGSALLLLLSLFLGLPISPTILATGVAIGIILSVLGAKRPLGLSKVLKLVSAGVLLVVIGVYIMLSGGSGDKYVQLVKSGTLNGYPQMTVGEAFDGFLANPKWESGLSDDNVRFVNVTGGILYYEKDAEIVVQFFVDEKNESFQYNACEINGIPQTNLVFWGLLEAIYNGDSASSRDSASKELGSHADPGFMSDKIMIGETQSYDNEFGNIEVTLDYVAFTDKLENTWTGSYEYPDESCVFLWAEVTMKNIGTKNGGLPIAWNTVVFDGEYEFRHHTVEGDITADLSPLTPPATGAFVFMVPASVMDSDKSLVLNINDGAGGVVLSFVIRSGDK